MLHELGRLRELTFRAACEGTGKTLDLDQLDALSSFVRLESRTRGGWSLSLAERTWCADTASASVHGDAVSLRRTFSRSHGSGPGVWTLVRASGVSKGLRAPAAFVEGHRRVHWRNPHYKTLFGPVSISNEYQAVSRELMVSFLEKYALLHDWAGLVRNRDRLTAKLLKGAHRPVSRAGFDIEDLSAMVGDLEQKPAGVPVLLRQYLRLGGKLLGFNVDPMFANTLDGLILVDLTKTEPKLLERYLGVREAAAFLEFQKGNNGTH